MREEKKKKDKTTPQTIYILLVCLKCSGEFPKSIKDQAVVNITEMESRSNFSQCFNML